MKHPHVRRVIGSCVSLLLLAGVPAASVAGTGGDSLTVKAKPKPDKSWGTYQTRALATLSGFTPASHPPALDKFGGLLNRKEKATGFFYPKKIGDRWWLVDPEGGLFLNTGVDAVVMPKSGKPGAAFQKHFASRADWASQTTALLRSAGFNGAGAWSDVEALRAQPQPLVYTEIWNFMGQFAATRKLARPGVGHLAYPDGCIPVFHPDFEAWCNERAKALAATRNDPFLLGHFSDNEMPQPSLEKYLQLDVKAFPGMESSRQAARDWLEARKGKGASVKHLTAEDRSAWAQFVLERYHRIVTTAIRRVDPNHMCLGSRYHGPDRKSEAAFRAASKYLDVIAYNFYADWGMPPKLLKQWNEWSGRPILVSEFYVKGDDVGFNNRSGAGWVVPTQKDRGEFYQHFALDCLQSKVCVGWHWFKYTDQGPTGSAEGGTDDANKGIVNLTAEPYRVLLDAMRPMNENIYGVADYFDQKSGK